MKICNKKDCKHAGIEQPLTNFKTDRNYCRSCEREYSKEYHKKHPRDNEWNKKNRKTKQIYDRRRKYNLSDATFRQMILDCNNCCAICLVPFENEDKIHVDHCHKTGKVRGLLCRYCNNALGFFKDNIENLERAIDYLK